MIPRELLAESLRMMELEIHKHGWDKPPLLLYMAIPIPDQEGLFTIKQVRMIFNEHPATEIQNLGNRLMVDHRERQRLLHKMRGVFYGFAFMMEAYSISAEPGTAEMSEAMAAAMSRTIRYHPDKLEVRSLTAITITGEKLEICRRRDTDDVIETWDLPDGSIPKQLERLVKIFHGSG